MNYDIVPSLNKIEKYGKVIYILGSAEKGAVNTPVKIQNDYVLYETFGLQGTIIDGYRQIMDTATDVEVYGVKVTGNHAKLYMDLNIKERPVVTDGLIFKSRYANEIYNNINIRVDDAGITFYFPIELGGGFNRYNFANYEVLGLLIRAINEDTRQGVNHVYVYTNVSHGTPLDGLLYPVNPDLMKLEGGYSGLEYSKASYYFSLQDTYDLLESEYIDIIVPMDAFMDDIHPRFHYGYDQFSEAVYYSSDRDYLDLEDASGNPITFHRQLIDFCKKQMRFGLITHGIMGFNKIPDIEELNNQEYNYIDVINATPIVDRLGFKKEPETDDGFFISVVAGELEYSDGKIANGFTAYAGLMASVTVASSLTNKTLGEKVKLATVFDTDTIDTMAKMGVVSFRDSVLKGLVVSNAVTPVADPSNEMHFSCNVRMIQLTLSFMKLQLDKFLGEDINKLVADGTIDTTITNLLDHLKTTEVLKDYKYSTNIDWETGHLKISLDLKTLYMVEYFSASAGANFKV